MDSLTNFHRRQVVICTTSCIHEMQILGYALTVQAYTPPLAIDWQTSPLQSPMVVHIC